MAFGETGILDNFNRTNESPLTGWTETQPALQIISNQVTMVDGIGGAYFDTAKGPDVEAYITLVTITASTTEVSFGVRVDWALGNLYRLKYDAAAEPPTLYLIAEVDGTPVEIGAAAITLTSGDKIGISAIGTAIKGYVDTGSGWIEAISATDSTITGAGNIYLFLSNGSTTADNLGGGTLAATPPEPDPEPDNGGLMLRLIQGDKRHPTKTLDLHDVTDQEIILEYNGFSPGPGRLNEVYSGTSIRFDGERLVGSSRGNGQWSLKYKLSGDGSMHLGAIQREIDEFALAAQLYEVDGQGEPVWLEYRWGDGLSSLDAPVFGQLSHYLKVYSIDIPAWPDSLHTAFLMRNRIPAVVANFVCGPFAEGLSQQAGLTPEGGLAPVLASDGLQMPISTGVLLTHTSFEPPFDATVWKLRDYAEADKDDASALITAAVSTTYAYAGDWSMHLTGTPPEGGTAFGWGYFEGISLVDEADYRLTFYARKADGGAITASAIAGAVAFFVTGVGWNILTYDSDTTFTAMGGGWYKVVATLADLADTMAGYSAEDSIIGLNFMVELDLYVDGFTLEQLTGGDPVPQTAAVAYWPMTTELSSEWSGGGWYKPAYSVAEPPNAAVQYIFVYYGTAEEILLYWDAANSVFFISYDGTTEASGTAAVAFDAADWLHLFIRLTTDRCYLYINGAQVVSLSITRPDPADCTPAFIVLGSGDAPALSGNCTVDGWRLWDSDIGATLIPTIYANELVVKNAGKIIGLPPVFWTPASQGEVGNCLDAARKNYGVVVGVSGDVGAATEYRLSPPTSSPAITYWLGRKATIGTIDPYLLWQEFQGTADATSSGGEYNAEGADTTDFYFETTIYKIADLDHVPGDYAWLAHLSVQDAETLKAYACYDWQSGTPNASLVKGDPQTITGLGGGASYCLYKLPPAPKIAFPGAVVPSVWRPMVFVDRTASVAVWGDFLFLLPRPFCEIRAAAGLAIASGEKIYVEGRRAYTLTATGEVEELLGYYGENVTMEPGRYNYLYCLQGEDGAALDITQEMVVEVFITPRWLLPGGAVA